MRDLENRTIDRVHIGEAASESAHALQGERSRSGGSIEPFTHWRDTEYGGWFSFEMKVLPDAPLDLVCTYWGDDAGNRTFDILIDGRVIATQTLDRNHPGQYFRESYPIPPDLIAGKQKVTVRFAAKAGKLAGD